MGVLAEMGPTKWKGRRLPLLPLRGLLVYPSMVLHLDVGRGKSVRALEKAMLVDQTILLCSQSEVSIDEPTSEDIYRVGTIVHVRQLLRLPNGTIRVLVEGLTRAEIKSYLPNDDFYEVMVKELPEKDSVNAQSDALMRTVLHQFERYIKLSGKVSPETLAAVRDILEPGRLADVITSHLTIKIKEKQKILETLAVDERLETLLNLLNVECEVLELDKKINIRVKQQMEKTQKDYYLREQMKAIQKELGDKDGRAGEVDELRQKLQEAALPEIAHTKVEKEIDRLEKMAPTSAESTVVRNYIDWLLALPWSHATEDTYDLVQTEQILNDDHFGLEKPKERILEYLAVQQLVKTLKGPIICLVGPPGVGKTSLARSIAKSLNRKFVRLSLGGVRDESEIRGHRRTYVGALPGRIITSMKNAGSTNPVMLLDEIDKMTSDFRGDPSAALLEVLDPEQNHSFTDHYIEVPYNLSNVMFITTANSLSTIPRPLLDRMEIITLSGYTEVEKFEIASKYLLPKQRTEHGLQADQLTVHDEALVSIVRHYTREAGVRKLEQQLAAICRKSVRQLVSSPEKESMVIDCEQVKQLLGPPKYRYGSVEQEDQVGAVTGLAWTEVGGDTLVIEVIVLPGKGKLTLTGKLGDVMKESAQAAFSYMRSRANVLNIDPQFYEKNDIHIHIPEGAIPKDGPSAGITMATALVSALSGRKVNKEVAMTGEVTLRGNVLAIGGLKEKSLAAHRAGVKTILFPQQNERDLVDVPLSIREQITFIPVAHMDEVLTHALREATTDDRQAIPWLNPESRSYTEHENYPS